MHERGYTGASVRDIVEAAGVPQGSFTNHFISKEAFCLEVLDLYFRDVRAMIQRTLRNDSLPPPKRLHAFVDAQIKYLIGSVGETDVSLETSAPKRASTAK